ncbi:MAG: hypothetical protein ABJF23_31115 [Bryobacteraceae bacterium]
MIHRYGRGRLTGIILLAGGVCVMAQADEVDSKFVTALRTNISGIYFNQVAQYQPPEIERQFRAAVQHSALIEDEEFMANLFYLVRMKQVTSLREEVWRVIGFSRLPPAARVSGLKTAYAVGGPNDRLEVDRLESEALAELIRSGRSPEESPYVQAADRIGGSRTLVALRRLQSDAAARQAANARQQPNNFSLISQLDKVRDRLERQISDLTQKTAILAQPEPARTAQLARVYMSRPAFLTCWAYRELLAEPSPKSRETVRDVVTRLIPTFLPSGGQTPETRSRDELDLRLRGIALLEKMGATLTPDQLGLMRSNESLVSSREPFFYPACTWEDVMDVV